MTVSVAAAAFRADPYPIYEQVRGSGTPVIRLAEGPWAVLDHAPGASLLEDRRFAHWHLPRGAGDTVHGRLLKRWLTLMDPASHTRLRQLTARLLSAARVQLLEDELRHVADGLMPRAPGTFDVVSGFARPLTLSAAATLLGVPDADRDTFDQLVTAAGPRLLSAASADTTERDRALLAVREFVFDLVDRARGRAESDRDLPGCLHAAAAHDGLTRDDLLAFTVFFLFASHENLLNFIGNAFLALVRRPDARRALARRRRPADVDELLRFDSPVQFISLLAKAPVEIAGTAIAADDLVWVAVGAANRDPRRFTDPASVLLDRPDNQHLSFGRGSLFCPGAMLARLEGSVALEALTTLANPRLTSASLCWREHPIVLRGLHSLPVAHDGVAVQ